MSSHDGETFGWDLKIDFAPTTCIFAPKISFFLGYAHVAPFCGLRRTRLKEIITSLCPEVTLDTFGFPVVARSAARQAVFWHRLPKMALFGANDDLFWSEMHHMLSYSITRYFIAFHCIIWYILLPYGIAEQHKIRSRLGTQCMSFFSTQHGIHFVATKSAVF